MQTGVGFRFLVVALTLAALAPGPTAAGAATTIGQTGTGGGCPGPTPLTVVQADVAGPPAYAAPAGGGVITSWSHQANASAAVTMRLKVYRPTPSPSSFFVVDHSSVEAITPSVLNTFATRIPVQAGEVLGLSALGGAPDCIFLTGAAGDQMRMGGVEDPAPGTTAGFSPPAPMRRLNISASLEPDSDGDGFGDETQDQCPTDATKQSECVSPETTITKRPKNRTTRTRARFKFSSSEPGSTFECSFDDDPFAPCTSPETERVGKGRHNFEVRAIDAAANVDGSPAADSWRVTKQRKR